MAAALGVPTLLKLPFAFFNILSPLLSVLYGITRFKVEKTAPSSELQRPARRARTSPRAWRRSEPMSTEVIKADAQKMPLIALTAMVVGSMVGAGVFSLPGSRADRRSWVSSPGPSRARDADARVRVPDPRDPQAGARRRRLRVRQGRFRRLLGFNSAFGYWASACVGNTFYWVFIMTTVGPRSLPRRRQTHLAVASRRSACGSSTT